MNKYDDMIIKYFDDQLSVDERKEFERKLDIDTELKDAFENYMRQRAFKKVGEYFNDFYEFKRAFPKLTYRHLIQPSEKVPMGALELDFSPKMVSSLINLGKKDGKAAVAQD